MRALSNHDRHVLAQDISGHWLTPDERAVAYQAAAEALRLMHCDGDAKPRDDTGCPR